MADEIEEDAALTPEEILNLGALCESQVWTPTFLAEKRAPIAVAGGRPKFGPVFNSDGVGKAVLIRPCVSRGKRIRGLPPIYTPQMLEANCTVFSNWPMYLDHLPSGVTEAAAKRGRSVKELGGQILTPYFDRQFVQEGDEDYGYQMGGVLSEIWATPYLRNLVGENANLLHTSIAAWPTSGKPKMVPWNKKVKGMAIEGIRRQPQGSVDFVPRGGAGGRLLPLAEGEDADTRAWPEPGMEEEDERLVVSLAESFYASAPMAETETTPDFSKMTPEQLTEHIKANAPHLAPALREAAAPAPAETVKAVTEEDVRKIVESFQSDATTAEDVTKLAEDLIEERETQRNYSGIAQEMIRLAEGIPATWKADLNNRYSVLPEGPQPSLLVEEETDDEGKLLSEEDVLRRNVKRDLDHARDLIAEATGKPRVTGEGGGSSKASGAEAVKESKDSTPYWRESFASMGIIESADDALSIHGVDTKVED